MIREILQRFSVDKNGVTIGDGYAIPVNKMKNVYIRGYRNPVTNFGDLLTTDVQFDKVIGWFDTKNNPAGYVVTTMTDEDKEEFGEDAFRIFSDKGTTVAKFDFKKGNVYFFDNEYYTRYYGVKFQSPMKYKRFFIDNQEEILKMFGLRGLNK